MMSFALILINTIIISMTIYFPALLPQHKLAIGSKSAKMVNLKLNQEKSLDTEELMPTSP